MCKEMPYILFVGAKLPTKSNQLNQGKYTMTKSEAFEIKKTVQYFAAGLGPDYLARSLSALHRAARAQNTKRAIEALATEHGVRNHPEFLIDHHGVKAYHAHRAQA